MSTNDKIYHNIAAWAKSATGRENMFLGCKAISLPALAWRNTVYLHCEKKRPCMCGRSRTQGELGENECRGNLCIFALCSVGLRWWQLKQVIKCHWVLWRHGYAIVMTWFCKNEKRLLWSEVRFSALLSIPECQTLLYFLAGVSPQLSNYSERVMECWSCLSTTTTKKKQRQINLGCFHTCFDSTSLPLLPQVFPHSIFGFELRYS